MRVALRDTVLTTLLATHSYSALSAGSALNTVSVLVICRLLPLLVIEWFPGVLVSGREMLFITLLHVMVGRGRPVAVHVNVALAGVVTVKLAGASVITGLTVIEKSVYIIGL